MLEAVAKVSRLEDNVIEMAKLSENKVDELNEELIRYRNERARGLEQISSESTNILATTQRNTRRAMEEVLALPLDRQYLNYALKRVAQAAEDLQKAKAEYDESSELKRLEREEVTKDYQGKADDAFNRTFAVISNLIGQRSNTYYENGGGGLAEVKLLQEELDNLIDMEENMKALGEDNPVFKEYSKRREDVENRVRTAEVKAEVQDAIMGKELHYPVRVNFINNNSDVEVTYATSPGCRLTELVDKAVHEILKKVSHKETEPKAIDNGVLRGYRARVYKNDIANMVTGELSKEAYQDLKDANIHLSFFMTETKEFEEEKAEAPEGRLYSIQEAADELNVKRSKIDNTLRIKNLFGYTVKEGEGHWARRKITEEGLSKIRDILADQKKPAKKKERKKVSGMYNLKEAAQEVGISYSALRNIMYNSNSGMQRYTKKQGPRRLLDDKGINALKGYLANRPGTDYHIKSPKAGKIKVPKSGGLTDKILALEEQGLSQTDIAKKLKIAPSTVNKRLKDAGVINEFSIKTKYNTLDKIRTATFEGAYRYSEEKQKIRTDMFEQMVTNLSDSDFVYYLGLEGPNFGSYIHLAQSAVVDPAKSLVVEREKPLYRMMKSIVANAELIEGGDIFHGLNLYDGQMLDAVKANKGMKFNFLNLDYSGPFSQEKMETLGALFENKQFMDEAVLYITLTNGRRDKAKLENGHDAMLREYREGLGTDDQHKIVASYLNELAPMSGYTITEIGKTEYMSRATPMLSMGFKVKKK